MGHTVVPENKMQHQFVNWNWWCFQFILQFIRNIQGRLSLWIESTILPTRHPVSPSQRPLPRCSSFLRAFIHFILPKVDVFMAQNSAFSLSLSLSLFLSRCERCRFSIWSPCRDAPLLPRWPIFSYENQKLQESSCSKYVLPNVEHTLSNWTRSWTTEKRPKMTVQIHGKSA